MAIIRNAQELRKSSTRKKGRIKIKKAAIDIPPKKFNKPGEGLEEV
ncbi:MAG: hypothetical protein ACXV8J_07870 [Methylobacter sp.]